MNNTQFYYTVNNPVLLSTITRKHLAGISSSISNSVTDIHVVFETARLSKRFQGEVIDVLTRNASRVTTSHTVHYLTKDTAGRVITRPVVEAVRYSLNAKRIPVVIFITFAYTRDPSYADAVFEDVPVDFHIIVKEL